MSFKLTYSDGQESDYGDDTVWEVEAGVLKMGREQGNWTVLLSPSHWAVVEVGGAQQRKDDDGKKDTDGKDKDSDQDDNDDDDAKDD
jgi:hypothetical protein